MRLVIEIIRIADAADKEKRHAKEKFGHITDLVDMIVQENSKGLRKTVLACESFYGINFHGERKKEINQGHA